MKQSARTTRGGYAFLLMLLLAFAAALGLSGNAMADTGVPCAPTGMESVSTPRDHYQPGEVATINGGGYAVGCDVQVDVQRPDGVVESFTASTDFGGSFTLDYQVPPPPGVPGQYRVVVRGLGGAELASMTFEDAPAPQFDIAPSHVATTGPRVFTAVVRNTASSSSDTARCIRITTPGSVTVSSASFVAASPTTTGPWTLTTGANFVQLRTSGAGVFGSASSSNNWVRFEVSANATAAGTNTWTARMTSTNADCASGGSTDQLGVSVAQVLPRQYTADFRDGANALIPAPTVVEDSSQAYRMRITRTAGTDDLQHIAIALPTCFTNITGISTTDSGPPAYTAELTDNMFRLVPNTKLAANGQWMQVHFTAIADCPTGAHEFRTASWKNTSPETGQGDIFQLSPGTFHPTLTVLSANVAPVANDDSYTVNEDTTLNVAAPGVLANDVDTQPLTAVLVSTTTNGTLTPNSNGSFSYTPIANFAGTDTFTYKANDGSLDSNVATVTITVSAVDDPPTAVADSATVGEDSGANAIDVLANDTDIDGGPKSVASVTQGEHGSVAITGGGTGASYTPDVDHCGPDSFTYTLNGGSIATVSITVECVNDAPVAAGDTASGTEDTNVVIAPADLLANDTDVDADDTLTVTAVGSASGGSVSFNDEGEIVFVPAENLCGADAASFEYTVEDEAGASDTATVTISLACLNDAPVAAGDTASGTEDTTVVIAPADLLANDTDADADDTLTVTAVGSASGGSVSFNDDGEIVFVPDPNLCGTDAASFEYTVEDEAGASDTATVTISLTCVDDAPTAVGDSATVVEDSGANAIDVLANDTDIDAGPKSVASVSQGEHGSVAITGGGTGVSFTPDADYCGPDSFTYTLNGGSTATVSVTVECVDDAPTAVGDSATVVEDSGANAINVLANDTDIDGGPKSVVSVTQGEHGSVAITGGGTGVSYTPDADYCGPDSFTYTLNGGSTATVSITVSCVNDKPTAAGDAAAVAEDEATGVLVDVLANDSAGPNESGQTLTITAVGSPSHGTAVVESGKIRYTPTEADYNGSDSFSYTVTDNGQTDGVDDFKSDSATVSVTITAVNDKPTAADDEATVAEDDAGGVLVDVTANDSAGPANESGQTLTITAVGSPSHGTAVVESGKIRYTPTEADYNGSDSFSYTIEDNGQTDGVDDFRSDSATVSVTITAVNDAPSFTKGADQTVAEDSGAQTVPGWATNISAGPSDESGQSIDFLVSNDNNGLFSAQPAVSSNGTLTYTPAANAFGVATVTVRAHDDGGTANGGDDTSDPRTFTITVTAVNDTPDAVDDSGSVDEDDATGVLIDVLANDSAGPNESGQTLTITNVGTASHGTAVVESGKVRYTPTEANYNGPDSFTYTIRDNGQTNGADDFRSDTATVNITVRPVNDAPAVAANNSSVTVNEGQTAANTGTWSDVDGDNVTLTASRGSVTKNAGGTWSWSEATTDDVPTTTVTITANDGNGGTAQATFSLTVSNVPPTLTSLTPSSYLVLKGTSVSVTGTYTDPGTGDTFTCIVNWDEPTGTPQSVAGGATSCSPSHTYTAQGTYTVSMKVRDDDGGESNTLTVIITVYDPGAGGFVTGGGWIISPAGSYAADPTASGRANFGFNSQYKKGASVPTGETEFQLHFATFNFHSEAYEVLVVSGHKAQYRGTGKVNGVSGYKFVLTAYDGNVSGGGGVDRFRIKITRISDNVVVYDTKMGTSDDMDLADPLAIGGGSIVIHKAK